MTDTLPPTTIAVLRRFVEDAPRHGASTTTLEIMRAIGYLYLESPRPLTREIVEKSLHGAGFTLSACGGRYWMPPRDAK
jgi:hypothetical protein